MKIKLFFFAVLCLLCTNLFAQDIKLSFNNDNKFKIVQFTDLHLVYNDPRSDAAFECINNVLEKEHPDLIILTGDMIYSKPAADNMRNLCTYISRFKIPFAITFGNHDNEQGLSNEELLKIAKESPYCIATSEKGITGNSNYVLEIKAHDSNINKALLYCIDSNQYSQLKNRGVEGYDFIHKDQINWYINKSNDYTVRNNGIPLPSLAFFHIPLPEYNQAASDENAAMYGIRREKACAPLLNTGMFAAMKEQGDIMGIFVGHDHDNDYAVNWYNVLLAYGRFSGGKTEYSHMTNGARIIELTEGKRIIDTYIRLRTGELVQNTSFPADYIK